MTRLRYRAIAGSWAFICGARALAFLPNRKRIRVDFSLFRLGTLRFRASLLIDQISLCFRAIVGAIVARVIIFSHEYRAHDLGEARLHALIIAFARAITALIFGGSLFILLLG